MGWLDMAVTPYARWSASGMPDAQEPLALASLRTHRVTDVTPESVKSDPPRQTLRTDLLKSGFVPGSEGDRMFVRAHGGVLVHDDPALSHADNERLFRATDVKRQRPRSSTPESFTGNLSEEQVDELKDGVLELSRLHGATLAETLDEVEDLMDEFALTPQEVVDALLSDDLLSDEVEELPTREEAMARIHRKLTAKVNEQLGVFRATRAKAPAGGLERTSPSRTAPDGEVSAPAPSFASGGARPDRSFKPSGKRKKGDGISTEPATRTSMSEAIEAVMRSRA